MKKIFSVVLGGCLLLGACAATEQKTITIKGKVQFPDNQYNMEIVERNGFDKTIIDSCKVGRNLPVYHESGSSRCVYVRVPEMAVRTVLGRG